MTDRCSIKTARIRELNDQLRCNGLGGRVIITRGIEALGADGVREVLTAVARFDDFTEDNGPWGEHDCAVLTVNGRRIIFKHDYYDRDLKWHSPDASDPAVTERVLTIMLSEEYRAGAMPGKQAKTLSRQQIRGALHRARRGRYPEHDRVMILLSVKAGLRAGEIAKLRWSMVLDTDGRLGHRIELHDNAAKKRSGRTIPLHPELRRALLLLRRKTSDEGALIRSECGGSRGMRPSSVVNWFRRLYCEIGLNGCSSHSGRRTFITNAARLVFKAGGSLRDVQQLAGHQSIEQTQAYIDGSARAKRRLIELI